MFSPSLPDIQAFSICLGVPTSLLGYDSGGEETSEPKLIEFLVGGLEPWNFIETPRVEMMIQSDFHSYFSGG